MAYNLFNLGIKGSEVKRRLDLLKNVSITNPIVLQSDLDAGKIIDYV